MSRLGALPHILALAALAAPVAAKATAQETAPPGDAKPATEAKPATDAKPAADAKAAATTSPDISGRWVYNVELSDDARQKMKEARAASGGGGGGYGGGRGGGMGGGMGRGGGGMGGGGGYGRGGGGGYGRGGGGYGGGSGSSTPSDSDMQHGKNPVFNPPLELKVTQTDAEIDLDDMAGKVRKLYLTGKKYKAEDGDAEVKASWKDGKLQVETKNSKGGSMTETWERVPDGSRLICHVKLEGGFGKVDLKRIYDRENPDTKTTGL
jgi:hypothetical protein